MLVLDSPGQNGQVQCELMLNNACQWSTRSKDQMQCEHLLAFLAAFGPPGINARRPALKPRENFDYYRFLISPVLAVILPGLGAFPDVLLGVVISLIQSVTIQYSPVKYWWTSLDGPIKLGYIGLTVSKMLSENWWNAIRWKVLEN